MKIVSLMYFLLVDVSAGCHTRIWVVKLNGITKHKGHSFPKGMKGEKKPFTYKDKKSPFVKAPMKKKISSAFGGDFKRLQYKGFCC